MSLLFCPRWKCCAGSRSCASAVAATLALAACALPPATGVLRLSDGVMKAATVQQAEAYCRTSGDPTRLLTPADARSDSGVLFRCD